MRAFIPVHARAIDNPADKFSFDFDGGVVQLLNFSAIRKGIPYLDLPRVTNPTHLHKEFPFLRKHFTPNMVKESAMPAFCQMLGMTLGMADGGYFMDLTALLISLTCPDPWLKNPGFMHKEFLLILEEIKNTFAQKLRLTCERKADQQ